MMSIFKAFISDERGGALDWLKENSLAIGVAVAAGAIILAVVNTVHITF